MSGLPAAILLAGRLAAGPYSQGAGDPANPHDAPVPGFVGPHGVGLARLANGQGGFENPDNYVNPVFFAWGSDHADYLRADGQTAYSDPSLALGEVTGDVLDVLSLGDLNATRIANGDPPGQVTIILNTPIRDFSGADFAVFENASYSEHTTPDGSIEGQTYAELARVEVSNNGTDFVRFAAVSLTPGPVGAYGTIDPTNIFQLAGKHGNSYGKSWGTPFDLAAVGLDHVTHVRLIDIPGNGTFTDSAGHPIYDAWPTFGSGGADLEAVGVISTAMAFANWPQLAKLPADQRGESDDPDGDGWNNLVEYAFAMLPWLPEPGRRPLAVEWVESGGMRVPELVFLRDQRLLDLTYELCVSTDLDVRTPLARSTGGQPVAGAGGQLPVIAEGSASGIASLGVLREVRVRDSTVLPGPRCYQIELTRGP
jgi:hypothetical protein